jgi:hypothetical protein
METKFCKFCGRQLDSDSAFCPKCGKQAEEPKTVNEGAKSNNTTSGKDVTASMADILKLAGNPNKKFKRDESGRILDGVEKQGSPQIKTPEPEKTTFVRVDDIDNSPVQAAEMEEKPEVVNKVVTEHQPVVEPEIEIESNDTTVLEPELEQTAEEDPGEDLSETKEAETSPAIVQKPVYPKPLPKKPEPKPAYPKPRTPTPAAKTPAAAVVNKDYPKIPPIRKPVKQIDEDKLWDLAKKHEEQTGSDKLAKPTTNPKIPPLKTPTGKVVKTRIGKIPPKEVVKPERFDVKRLKKGESINQDKPKIPPKMPPKVEPKPKGEQNIKIEQDPYFNDVLPEDMDVQSAKVEVDKILILKIAGIGIGAIGFAILMIVIVM